MQKRGKIYRGPKPTGSPHKVGKTCYKVVKALERVKCRKKTNVQYKIARKRITEQSKRATALRNILRKQGVLAKPKYKRKPRKKIK